MSIDSNSHLPTTTGMSAEAGFDGNELQAPIRISGFLCLILGLVSAMAFLSIGMLIVPALAIGFGVFALRRYNPPKPVGIKAAYIGMVLAVGFGMFGLGVPLFKKNTLGSQAEHFARDFLKVVAKGEDHYALELRKDHVNRFIRSMPLDEHYKSNENAQKILEEFREDGLVSIVRSLGPDAKWELDRPIRVFYSYGAEHADVVLANYDNATPQVIRVVMQAKVASDGKLQWHVENFMTYRERIVAESIL